MIVRQIGRARFLLLKPTAPHVLSLRMTRVLFCQFLAGSAAGTSVAVTPPAFRICTDLLCFFDWRTRERSSSPIEPCTSYYKELARSRVVSQATGGTHRWRFLISASIRAKIMPVDRNRVVSRGTRQNLIDGVRTRPLSEAAVNAAFEQAGRFADFVKSNPRCARRCSPRTIVQMKTGLRKAS